MVLDLLVWTGMGLGDRGLRLGVAVWCGVVWCLVAAGSVLRVLGSLGECLIPPLRPLRTDVVWAGAV